MRLARVGLVFAAFMALAIPSTGLAGGPIVNRYEDHQDFVETGCGFPVRVQLDGLLIDHLWFNEAGELVRLIGNAAHYTATLTNPATGETLHLNIPGSLELSFYPDGSRAATIRGPWLLTYRPESLEPGPPFVPWLFLFTGTRTLTVDAAGNREVIWRGRFVDLCAELASP